MKETSPGKENDGVGRGPYLGRPGEAPECPLNPDVRMRKGMGGEAKEGN